MKTKLISRSLLTSISEMSLHLLKSKNVCHTKSLTIFTLLVAFSLNAKAQDNTSYNVNSTSIAGSTNCAFGVWSLWQNTGVMNTATGAFSLYSNTSGSWNVATGNSSLTYNTTGNRNTALGSSALAFNTSGSDNTGAGYRALHKNTTGIKNTANGTESLFNNTTGQYNTANGFNALYTNTWGANNTANGYLALYYNTYGGDNVAIGREALYSNTIANFNTATGDLALTANTTGERNSAFGYFGLSTNITGSNNTAIGYGANVSASNLSNATAIGYLASVNASNKVRIGGAVSVVEGNVMYTVSDGRFKSNISESDVKGLEFIKRLRPVVYNVETQKIAEFWSKNMPDNIRKEYLNQDFKPSTAIRQTGFIAQEVEKAAQEAGYDFNGVHKPENENDNYSLAYGEFVVPLVKAVQEQQVIIETQDEKINNLQNQIDELKKIITSTPSGNTSNGTTAYGVELSDKGTVVLDQNVPNPFAEQTVINYIIPEGTGKAQMLFYNTSGQLIKAVDIIEKGKGQLNVFANDLTNGTYTYTLVVDGKIKGTKKMEKLK